MRHKICRVVGGRAPKSPHGQRPSGLNRAAASLGIVAGLALGIPAALFAGHLMSSLLYGMSGYDPFAFVAATMVLGVCAAVAGFIPARRAATIDPMKALRTE